MRPISAVAFSPPDGRYIATASYDRLSKVWDTMTGECVSTLRSHLGLIGGLAFIHDGKNLRLATAGHEDQVIKLWDPLTEQEILSLNGHTNFCHCLAVSRDGWRFATSGADGAIRLWDAGPLDRHANRWLLWERSHDHEIWSVACSPDGHFVASAGWDKTVRLWDAKGGSELHRFIVVGVAFCVRFSPDGRYLAATTGTSAGGDTRLYLWDTVTRSTVFTPIQHNGNPPYCLEFSPDGQYVLKNAQGRIADGLALGFSAGPGGRKQARLRCLPQQLRRR